MSAYSRPPPVPTRPDRNASQHRLFVDRNESRISYYANAIYFPNWRVYKDQFPSTMKLGYVSHVFYAFATPNEDGTISLSDEFADTQKQIDGVLGCLRAFTQTKQQYPHLKIILSVGGGTGSKNFATLAASTFTRHKFAQSAKELVDLFNLDGIDIDWEHPVDPQEGAFYIDLLAQIRSFLPAPQYILTSALPAGEWALQNINLSIASTYLNLVNLMTYDFAGPWTDKSGHHSQLWTPEYPHNDAARISCHSAVRYCTTHGVPAEKILLGIPCYGRSFLGARGPGQVFQGAAGEEGTFEYRDLPRAGATEHFDDDIGAAYCVSSEEGFVTYDNVASVKLKAAYAKQEKLGGLFYWTGAGDADARERSLVVAGYNTLHPWNEE